MLTRAITGFFFIAVLIAAVFFGQLSFVVFFSLVGIGSLYEFYTLVRSQDIKPNILLGGLIALVLTVVCGLYFLEIIPMLALWMCIPFVTFLFIAALFQKNKFPFHDIAYSLLGILYACVPFLFFISLGFIKGSYNPYIPMGFLIMLWTNDTGAYLSGRSLGRHKLFERISPNKTWEGFIGGVILAAAVSVCLHHYFGVLKLGEWISVAFIISVFGTLGDLVESMLKRSLGVKDSGSILPGHGGLLDRFDGLLVASPLVYALLLMIL